ncbi:MAG: cob(I)yrinic acid a,c-diamide adenosyltransferase [Alphaproteobacteria bacterium]|nr:cob(I)yrinic acid a,c-diamide adenosyltransferase [Alphaproteobacteria bacterium]MDX5369216.1 cob(I)yrinic acid a,c-diamide adenosyltransferase [Alphaproteobacteria bacterium]MDX5463912.1 cob(I)yrinic acid a,c-diamide adenosyltransferase [Alphaproteobacteria bacterium]
MVVLNKIYTRTGDAGETGLGTGQRVRKYDLRIEAYGTVDEANAIIGIVRQHIDGLPDAVEVDAALMRIQNDLFDLGADLCTPETDEPLEYEPLRMSDAQVTRLEREIDALNADLAPLRSFILPGGTMAAAYLHQARTVARRAERRMVALAERDPVNPAAIRYVNRLSDYLFVLGRHVNDRGAADVLWVPGANRG